MSRRTARKPKLKNNVTVRFSDEKRHRIDEYARVNGLCSADIIRMGVELILNSKGIKLKSEA